MLQLKENDKNKRAFSIITHRPIATTAEITSAPQDSGIRQITTRVILSVIFAFYCVTPDLAQARDKRTEESLKDDSKAPVEAYIDETGKPRFITGQFPYALALSKEAVAKQFLQDHRAEFGIPASHTFETTRVFADKGMNSTVVRVSQYVDGIPIFASDVAININADNDVRVVSGKFCSTNFDTETPTISKKTAINNASSTLGNSQLAGTPDAELVGLAGGNDGLLSWHVILNTLESDGAFGEWHYFIDARSGELLQKYDGAFHLLNRETFDAVNTVDVKQSILEIVEGGASSDKIAQGTHDNVGIVYDYFLNHHGRDGWDDLGGKIETYVHWGNDLNNAFYLEYYNGRINQPAMVFGDGDRNTNGLLPFGTALDVVAHEYTHGIVNHTAKLSFFYEQGRELNESFADAFAMFVDADDFLMGEDLFRDNDWDKGLEPRSFRSISNPSVAQKNHMSQYQIRDGHHTYFPHINAGITNKAFFKILSKIGRSDTEKTYYRALTTYMTRSTDFLGARLSLEQAAIDLFGPVSEQLAAVQSGFDAVGISPPPSDFVGVFVANSGTYPPADSTGRISKTFTHPGASAMKLDVSVWKNPGRPVYIKDGNGTVIYTYNGRFRDKSGFTTGPVLGDTITIEFYPDPTQLPLPRPLYLKGSPIIAGYVYDNNLDSTPPVISAAKASIVDPFTATISWRTDEPTDGQLQWGITSTYNHTSPLQAHKSINHEVILDRLMPETAYHFLAGSADSAGNTSNSSDVTFTTPVATDVVTISSVKWPALRNLKLTTASTDLSATLTVLFILPLVPDGLTIGEMYPDSKGKGEHNLVTRSWVNRRDTDTEIMVRSSSGGFARHIFPAIVP